MMTGDRIVVQDCQGQYGGLFHTCFYRGVETGVVVGGNDGQGCGHVHGMGVVCLCFRRVRPC